MSIGYVQTSKLLGGLFSGGTSVSTVVNNNIIVNGGGSGSSTNFFPNGIIVNGLSSFSDNVTFSGGITVTGTAPINMQSLTGINLDGPVTVTGDLKVSGTVTMSTLNVTGTTIMNNLTVSGTLLIGDLTVLGSAQLNTTLDVLGTTTLNSTIINQLTLTYEIDPLLVDFTKVVYYLFNDLVISFAPGFDGQLLILVNDFTFTTFDTGAGVLALSLFTTYIFQYSIIDVAWDVIGTFSSTP